jgi:hypothetical protein
MLTKYSPDGTAHTADALEVLVNSFEDAGVVFRMTPDGDMRIDMNGLGTPPAYADGLAAALTLLLPAIKLYVALRTIEGQRN